MAQSFQTSKSGRLGMLASVAVVVTALYFAKVVLIPIALAVMLSFLLAPLLIRLQRWGLRRIPALLIVVLLLADHAYRDSDGVLRRKGVVRGARPVDLRVHLDVG